MTKRRVRLGSGLDPQKLADTVQQAFDSFNQLPGLSMDASEIEDGWLHLVPRAGQDADGQPARVVGWLLTFGYPYGEEPLAMLDGLEALNAAGVRLVEWEAWLYASYWLPPDIPAEELAALVIALARQVQLVPDDAHVEIALEYGL